MENFAALSRRCIFRSDQRLETHVLVANELADHRLQWHGDRIDTRMCKISTASLSLYSLRYGAEVGIFPDLYDDFSLVHFSLSGEIEVEADRHRSHVPFGRALVQ